MDSEVSTDDYQIGEAWSKTALTDDILTSQSPIFQRAALATAKVIGSDFVATAFAIGEKNGEVLLATNHHVIESHESCETIKIRFDYLRVGTLRCARIVTTNTDLDLTIFSVSGVNDTTKAAILNVASSFSAGAPKKGARLITFGYGAVSNPRHNLMFGSDEDCKIFSPDNETRFMADPDELNPGPYKTSMFATGCDVSHGDSGSAFVDLATGDVVGLLSTGKVPKDPRVRDTSYLKTIYDSSSDDVWKQLTYVVPATKIRELVGEFLPSP